MAGPGVFYAQWNKSDRERQIIYIITYMWNLKNKMNITKQKQTHRYKKLVVTSGGSEGERGKTGVRD